MNLLQNPGSLIATTALVATATVAAADVSFSGYGRFGAKYDDSSKEVTAASRLRLQADMKAASDNGLSFAARYRIQAEENAAGGVNGARFTVSNGALTIGAGNIGGAIEFMPGLYDGSKSAGIGLEGTGFVSLPTNTSVSTWKWDAYSSGGAGATNGVEAIYSAGALGVHVSVSKDNRTAAHVSYSAGAMTVAVASQKSDTAGEDKTVLTASYDMGSAKVALAYADNDGTKKTVLRGSTNMGGVGVYGFVGDENTTGVDNTYGIGLSYDLGAGTSFEAGMTSNETGVKSADAGFFFKF